MRAKRRLQRSGHPGKAETGPRPEHAGDGGAARPRLLQAPAATTPAATAPPATAATEPNRAQAYYHLALAAVYQDDATSDGRTDEVNKAIEEYKLALNADPNSAELADDLADLYFRHGPRARCRGDGAGAAEEFARRH